MIPVVANIREEWDWVGHGLANIHAQFPYLPYRPEDIYTACINGSAILYTEDNGFAVFTIEENPISREKSFLCWAAWGSDRGELIPRHFKFFCQEADKYGCSRLSTKTPIDGLEKIFIDSGWRCDMRDFSFDLEGVGL